MRGLFGTRRDVWGNNEGFFHDGLVGSGKEERKRHELID